MLEPEHRYIASKFPWMLFAFLFAVFAMSSWNVHRPQDGYDAANAAEISDTAETGSLGREIALIVLGLYAVSTLRSPKSCKVRVNGMAGIAFIAYVGWACASVLWSTDIDLTSKAVVRLLLMCLGALAIARQLSIRQIAQITLGISLLTALVSVVIELRSGTFDVGNPSWRLSGVMHPVSQGWNCGLLSISAMYLLSDSSRVGKYMYGIAMPLGLVFLALSKSRMALAGTLLSMTVYYLWNSTPRQRVLGLIVSFLVLCLALVAFGNNISHYAAFGRESETEASFDTLTGRIPLWEECIRSSKQRPLCGYGYNAFLSPVNLLSLSDASGWMSSPHSGYVGALFELGALGLLLLVATLFLSMRVSIRKISRDQDQLFVFCVLVWIAVNLILEAFLITGCFFATFLALTLLAKSAITGGPSVDRLHVGRLSEERVNANKSTRALLPEEAVNEVHCVPLWRNRKPGTRHRLQDSSLSLPQRNQ